ncbi:MAG: threonine/serine exporter family protein [Anaerovoracaceae bacterium]|nr:threonine/serine exporter family protein [Bacillota bacterium]MDY5770435.1 threonine/serine exporter family protein [Anaerovoracaceae bacterium]
MIIQTAAAFLGSIGFAVFLKMKGKQIVLAGIGGGVTWLVYLLMQNYIDGYFVPYLIASIFVGIYAEIMARVNKAPATIFLTAAAVPLIPGGSLYYTMLGIVEKDSAAFSENGIAALTIALAISLGFVIVALSNKYINIFLKRKTR